MGGPMGGPMGMGGMGGTPIQQAQLQKMKNVSVWDALEEVLNGNKVSQKPQNMIQPELKHLLR
jgi:hypothetical protein